MSAHRERDRFERKPQVPAEASNVPPRRTAAIPWEPIDPRPASKTTGQSHIRAVTTRPVPATPRIPSLPVPTWARNLESTEDGTRQLVRGPDGTLIDPHALAAKKADEDALADPLLPEAPLDRKPWSSAWLLAIALVSAAAWVWLRFFGQ